VDNDIVAMPLRSVSNIIHRGGTVIKTSRCEAFFRPEGRARAVENMRNAGIDALIVIGGDGSFHGAKALEDEFGACVVGVPGTIDNDLFGTDFTIGYDTAINTAAQCIDKIRDTAESHDRTFIIEVMGRHAGFIALDTGVATGCEEIFMPETASDIPRTCSMISEWRRKGKTSMLIIVAEGDEEGGAFEIARKMNENCGEKFHVTILGHIQRGGDPTVRDRVLASKLGAAAVDAVRDGKFGCMTGEINGQIVHTPLEQTWTQKKAVDGYLVELARVLAT
jgi:6-phosphofructokinase 1